MKRKLPAANDTLDVQFFRRLNKRGTFFGRHMLSEGSSQYALLILWLPCVLCLVLSQLKIHGWHIKELNKVTVWGGVMAA